VGDFGDALSVFRANRRIREAKQAVATRLRDARIATFVKVVGVLDGDPTLRAALTLEPCLTYRIRCGERRDDLGMSQFFATNGASVPFTVVDDDGRRVSISVSGISDIVVGASFTDVTAATVAEDNYVLTSLIGAKLAARVVEVGRLRTGVFLQDRFVPGERVVVHGLLEETTEVLTAGYRDAVGRGLGLTASPDQPLVLCRP
jgi:hypothetical protein